MIQSNLQDTVVVIEVKVIVVVVVVMQQGLSHWVLQLAITPTPVTTACDKLSGLNCLWQPRKLPHMFIINIFIYIYIYIDEEKHQLMLVQCETEQASWIVLPVTWV